MKRIMIACAVALSGLLLGSGLPAIAQSGDAPERERRQTQQAELADRLAVELDLPAEQVREALDKVRAEMRAERKDRRPDRRQERLDQVTERLEHAVESGALTQDQAHEVLAAAQSGDRRALRAALRRVRGHSGEQGRDRGEPSGVER